MKNYSRFFLFHNTNTLFVVSSENKPNGNSNDNNFFFYDKIYDKCD